MNFAIKEPWYSKIFSFQNQEKQNTTPQPLLFFEKSFFVDNEITMAIEFDKEYINKIKKENREINQNIFYDFNCNEYKYPQLVLEQLKTNYIFTMKVHIKLIFLTVQKIRNSVLKLPLIQLHRHQKLLELKITVEQKTLLF